MFNSTFKKILTKNENHKISPMMQDLRNVISICVSGYVGSFETRETSRCVIREDAMSRHSVDALRQIWFQFDESHRLLNAICCQRA